AIAVAEPRFLADVGRAAGVGGRGADEVVAADELVVAAALVDAARCAAADVVASPERVGVRMSVDRIDRVERGTAEVDPRIEDAEDDAFALSTGAAGRGPVPHRRGAD